MADDPNAAAAGNVVSAGNAGGLRNLVMQLLQTKIQQPLIDNQVAQGKQNLALGQNNLALSNDQVANSQLQTQKTANQSALSAFQPDFDSVQSPAQQIFPAAKQAAVGSATSRGFNPSPDSEQYADIPYPQSKEDADALGQSLGVSIPWVEDPAGRPATWTVKASKLTPPEAPDYSGQYFSQMPPAAQKQLFDQYKSAAPHPSLVTPEEVAQAHDSKVQATRLPPLSSTILSNPSLSPTSASIGPNGPSIDFKSNVNIAQPVSTPGGGGSPFVNVNGQILPNPSYIKPEDVTKASDDLQHLQGVQQQTSAIKSLLDAEPNLVGKGVLTGGGEAAQLYGKSKAFFGAPEQMNKQRQIQQWLTDQVIDSLGLLHMGRVTEREFDFLKNRMPTMSDPKGTWDNYINQYQKILNNNVSLRQQQLSPYTQNGPGQVPNLQPGVQIQPVNTSSSPVVPGSNGGSANTLRTVQPGEEGSIKPGETVIWGPTGQKIRKN